MQKKMDMFLKICIIGWVIIVTCFFIFNIKGNTLEINGETFNLSTTESILISFVLGVLVAVSCLVFPPFNVILIYLFYHHIAKNKIRVNAKFEKQNLTYCREHLNKLSPGVISFLKDFSIEPKKDISAHILKLLYEDYLVEQNGIIQRSSKSLENLSKADLVVLTIVEQRELTAVLQQEYETAIIDEATKEQLISFKNKQVEKVIFKFIIITMLLPFVSIIYFIASLFSLFKYKTNIVRTPKGDKILKNALGLNKFLTDIGHFEQMHYEKVYVRGYYLIYAVVLEINKEIPKEIIKKIEL